MRKEEFTFDSRDGQTKLYAVRYIPDGEIKGIVQIVHGMCEHISRYEDFALFLVEKGFLVTGNDHLGHGDSIPEGGIKGYFCEGDAATVVVRDVHRLKKLTQEAYPGHKYIIFGHSMGSFILRNYICRYGTGIDGAIISGTGMTPKLKLNTAKCLAAVINLFGGSKKPSKLLTYLSFGSYNKRIKDLRTISDWLTRDEKIVDKYNEDPFCGFMFTGNGYKTLFELISRLYVYENLINVPKDLPLFFISGTEDPVGNYGADVKLAVNSLEQVGVHGIEVKFYEGDRHELVNELDKDRVMRDICNFIDNRILK
ncbi:MAG: lysophospholipase [Acetatifactor sp.]|nr:lysophospholipase [Acetatifactor sp.]